MIKISLLNFVAFLKGHTLPFILVVSGLFTTVIGLLFIFGYEYKNYIYDTSFSKAAETMTLSLNQNASSDELIDLVDFFIYTNGSKNFPDIDFLTTTYRNSGRQLIVAEYFSGEQNYYVNGHYFNQNSDDVNEIILSENYMLKLDSKFLHDIFGKDMQFDNNVFKVIGSCYGRYKYDESGNGVFIPLRTYIRLGYPTQYLDVSFSKPLSSEEKIYLNQMLGVKSFVNDIVMPVKADVDNLRTMFTSVGKHFLLLSVSLIALLNLLSYWLRSSRQRFRVYIICGSTNKVIMFIIAINALTLSISSGLLACLVYSIIQPALIKRDIVIEYPWFYSVGICATIIAVSFIYSLVIGIRFLRKQNLSSLQVAIL